MTDAPIHPMPGPLARLRALTEAYGADPNRWPADERPLARAPVAASADQRAALQTVWADEAALDHLLAAVPAPPLPSAALRAAILAAAPQPRRRSLADRARAALRGLGQRLGGDGFWHWRPAGAVLASALALGMVSGSLLPAEPGPGGRTAVATPIALAWQGNGGLGGESDDADADLLTAALLDGDSLDLEGDE